MRNSNTIRRFLALLVVCVMMFMLAPPEYIRAEEDKLDYVRVDKGADVLQWDSIFGPQYTVRLSTGELLGCTCNDGQILRYELADNTVTVTVISKEYAVETTYVIDVTEDREENIDVPGFEYPGEGEWEGDIPREDVLESYSVSVSDGIVEWDSSQGPFFKVNYHTGEILSCTSFNAKVISYELKNNVFTITVISDERTEESTYIFDVSKDSEVYVDNDGIVLPGYGDTEDYPEDVVEYFNVLFGEDAVEWDSSYGPYYKVDFTTGELLSCSSTNAKAISHELKDGVFTITVTSDERKVETSYQFNVEIPMIVVDARKSIVKKDEDIVTYANYSAHNNQLTFDSAKGPMYTIDLDKMEILSCTSDGAKLISGKVNDNKATICVYSQEFPREYTYKIDFKNLSDYSQNGYKNETVEFYNVYSSGILDFDSSMGPWYQIDYKNNLILGCSSSEAKILEAKLEGDIYTVTLQSQELPVEVTYIFDLKENVREEPEFGAGYSEFTGQDRVEFFNILRYEDAIEFDTEFGPYYKICLSTGEILECTSNEIYPDKEPAKLLELDSYGNHITVTVYSAELPYNMTYTFDTKKYEQSSGVSNYDKEASKEEGNKVIDEIINEKETGNKVDNDTKEKIKKAHEEGKEIIIAVEAAGMIDSRVDQEILDGIKKMLESNNMEAIQFMDIGIAVYAGGEKLGNIKELEQDVAFTVNVDKGNNKDGNYYVLRYHEGEIELLELEEEEITEHGVNMTFETDSFSTYAIVYQNATSSENILNPPVGGDNLTGDMGGIIQESGMKPTIIVIMVVIVGILMVGGIVVRRRKNN